MFSIKLWTFGDMETSKHIKPRAKRVYDRIFRLSIYFGLFPLTLSGSEIKVSPSRLALTAIPLLGVPMNIYLLPLLIEELNRFHNSVGEFINFSVFPLFALSLVPVLAIIQSLLVRKNLMKLLNAIALIEGVTQYQAHVSNKALVFVSIFILCQILLESSLFDPNMMLWYQIFYYFELWLCSVLLSQFTSLVNLIGRHYGNISATLDQKRAVVWTQCHEVLGVCCGSLISCFSPQLFALVGSCFGCICLECYIILRSPMNRQNFFYVISCVSYTSILLYLIWYIVFCCNDVVQKDRKFDKLLYQLVLNDQTKAFIKNKRVVQHFKAKRQVEFSVMGFFNFDYGLLCSVASVATTYIVIMLQFS